MRSNAICRSGEFVWTGGDCHLYLNHLEQADEQLDPQRRMPCRSCVIKRKPPSIFEYEYDDFEVLNYQAHARHQGAHRGVNRGQLAGWSLDQLSCESNLPGDS